MANLRSTLLAWREREASKKGVELFRVLPTSTIDEIVRAMPKTKDELTAIKGIKDAKFTQYGMAILSMIKDSNGITPTTRNERTGSADDMMRIGDVLPGASQKEERTLYSVSSYLDIVNRELWRLRAPIKGEVTSFKFQGNAVYFSIRDEEDGATLSVFMWTSDFSLSGIELAEGLEVVVEGRGEIYKPSGRFSFRAETIELVGEGAFKKAYDALKKKLDIEGLFDITKKRELGAHPIRIGLVTSRTGAVIHDFLNNLGRFGFHITFVDARVEGASAVKDILSALTMLELKQIDVLILIRGGGSLESLQAFNNEQVVRAIANFPAVTVCAIGHDKDVPLAQLVADYAPSTPTATTVLLNSSWERSIHEIARTEANLFVQYAQMLRSVEDELIGGRVILEDTLEQILTPFREISKKFSELPHALSRTIAVQQEALLTRQTQMFSKYTEWLKDSMQLIKNTDSILSLNDPIRQLRLGYSLIMKDGKILRSVEGVTKGEYFDARLADGTLNVQVINVNKST